MSSKVYDPTQPTSPPPPPPAGSREHPFPPAAAPPDPTDDDGKNPAAEAFDRIKNDVGELKEYAGHYIAAKIDGIKQTVRNIGLYAALGVLGLIAAGAIVATAAGLLIVGVAELLSWLFGDRHWLGDIVTGLLVLGVIGVGAWWMMNKLTSTWRSQTVKKYEQRKQSQRERFGHDVPGAPQKQPQPQQPSCEPQDDAKKQPSEADYLAREQAQASAAITAVLADMKRAMAQGVDVRQWTRQHPLIMAGTATVAGFVAGMLVTPSKKETFKDFFGDKWEAFKEKLTPPATATATVGNPPPPAAQPEQSSILGSIIKATIQAIGPAIGGMITGAMAGEAEGAKNGNPNADSHPAAEATTRAP